MTTTEALIAQLGVPTVIEQISFETCLSQIRADLLVRYPAISGIIDLESEPVQMLLQAFSYRETILRARINDAARSNLIAFATGADLDHLAAFYDVARLGLETDTAFRRRIILNISGRSPGGTAPRYMAVALGADVSVADAVVYRDTSSPLVYVAIVSTDVGGIPSPALLTTVSAALNNPNVRMVNDTISVISAVSAIVNITADVWLLPDVADSFITTLEAKLRSAWATESALGFDLNISWLTSRLMQSGVQKVIVTAPAADTVVPYNQRVALGTVTLNIKGRAY